MGSNPIIRIRSYARVVIGLVCKTRVAGSIPDMILRPDSSIG
jgi:hypothetical protein